tara:strand:- start:1672 stop:2721 length:1050 start_codon:yes stop_codon:yes gene_type:complete
MNDNLNLVLEGAEEHEQFVQVPIKRKDFGDFITSLLGQPETIRDKKIGTYQANLEWLIHLHHLLDQRIKQQASASLVDFTAFFNYVDAPERKITSIDSFLSFNEAKRVKTKGIKLTWTYLVSFPNKPTPEKQEISLTLQKDRTEIVHLGASRVTRHTTSKNGLAAYSISHTERTWGDDIQSLIDKELESLFEKEKWYEKVLSWVVLFLALACFVAGIVVPDLVEQLIIERDVAIIYSSLLPDGTTLAQLPMEDKVTLITKLLDPNNQLHKVNIWYRAASFLCGTILAGFTIASFERVKESFILVTAEDEKQQRECRNKNNWSLAKKVFSFSIAVSAGVIGNYAYYLFTA